MEMIPLTQRGLERSIKRRLTSKLQTFAVITTPGFEAVTGGEIESVTHPAELRIGHGIIEFEAPFDAVYRLNLHLSTASRILLRLGSFTARSYPELFNKLHRLPWELYTGFHPDIGCIAASRSSRLHHTAVLCKTLADAVTSYLLRLGVRKTYAKTSSHTVYLRLHNDRCTVSMDTTGVLLHKRGYRTTTGGAPLRETAAAALLLAVNWKRYPVIADPCCGSGGIIIEARRLAAGLAPGYQRDFAFTTWPSYRSASWNHFRTVAIRESPGVRLRLFAGDHDERAIAAVGHNCSAMHDPVPAPQPEIRCADCMSFNRDGAYGTNGLLISNLPFGRRIGVDGGMEHFHRTLGASLRKHCGGWSFGFLVADPHFERQSGLGGTTVLAFRNGGLPVRFVTGTVPR